MIMSPVGYRPKNDSENNDNNNNNYNKSLQSLVGKKSTHVLGRMQKAVLSATLNITRTFKVLT